MSSSVTKDIIFLIILCIVIFIAISFRTEVAYIVVIIAIFTLIWAIFSGREQINKLSDQLNLLEKHVFGEVYDTAQIRDLSFSPLLHNKIENKPLKETKLTSKTKNAEIAIQWKMDKKQSLRNVNSGFSGNIKSKPIIEDSLSYFRSKTKSLFLREEYRDCYGWWHLEYSSGRVVPENEDFEMGYKIKLQKPGKFKLNVHIYTDEAKEPYKGELSLIVE